MQKDLLPYYENISPLKKKVRNYNLFLNVAGFILAFGVSYGSAELYLGTTSRIFWAIIITVSASLLLSMIILITRYISDIKQEITRISSG